MLLKLKTFILTLWTSRKLRFLVVGGLNTLFGYLLYSLFIFVQTPISLALLFATALGIVFNFFTHGRVVFKNSNNLLIFKFVLHYSAMYFFNNYLIHQFVSFKLNPYEAQLVCMPIIAIFSYLSLSRFVYK